MKRIQKKVVRKSRRASVSDGLKWILVFILDRLARQYLERGHKRMAIFSFDYVSNFIVSKGVYEGEELDLLFDYLVANDSSIYAGSAADIGANIGNHAVYFSERFTRVVCFEANPIVFDVLAVNAKMAGNIVVRYTALSDHVGEGELRFDPANLGSGSLFDPGPSSVGKVPLTMLDSYADELSDLRLIKVDVQGAELSVLTGGRELIQRAMPLILFEQVPDDIEGGTSPSIELLRSYGYRRFLTISTKLFRPVPIGGGLALVTDILFDAVKPPVLEVEEVTTFEKKIYAFILAVPPDHDE